MKEQLTELHAAAKDVGMQIRVTNGMGAIGEDGTIHTESGSLVLKDWTGGPVVALVNFENANGEYPNGLPEFEQAAEMMRRIVGGGEIK